ncbi:MAG TPA: DUF1772 domain-containing protein [Myxococcaceae bacterium]|nr:DUF1772 domain-containing protein [Myxococcaceae bacterium]
MLLETLRLLTVFLAGLLAGEELVIRYGVCGPVAGLEEHAQIRLRQALIRRLRILVPIVLFAVVPSGVAVVILGGIDRRETFAGIGVACLIAFLAITLGGTVPIDQATLTWDPAAPPRDWRQLVRRWERLDTARTWAALAAFLCFLLSLAGF